MSLSLKIHLREAIRQLLSSKLRAFLAVLGILVGTASVVAMVSIGQLAENEILSQFKSLGINLLSISIFSKNYDQTQSNPMAGLSLNSAQNITQSSHNLSLSAPYINNYGNVIYQGIEQNASAVGITTNMISMAQLSSKQGRLLSFLDQDQSDYFCVIGNTLANTLAQNLNKNLLNTQIQIGDNIFTIVGVLNNWPTNFFFNTDFNNSILIPISTALNIQKNSSVDSIALRVINTNLLPQTELEIKNYIQAHTIDQQVSIRSPKSLIDSMEKSSETMTILLGLIGSISLLVGGIGIMNIMLVSVTERHKEIGIRKAVGAKNIDIILQFLIEAIVLSIFGGMTGMFLGIFIAYLVAVSKHWAFSLFLLPPLIGCLVTISVGIFFGFYPAYKASKLDPIETLRSE